MRDTYADALALALVCIRTRTRESVGPKIAAMWRWHVPKRASLRVLVGRPRVVGLEQTAFWRKVRGGKWIGSRLVRLGPAFPRYVSRKSRGEIESRLEGLLCDVDHVVDEFGWIVRTRIVWAVREFYGVNGTRMDCLRSTGTYVSFARHLFILRL